jgi:uncharacterized membrane protein YfcA
MARLVLIGLVAGLFSSLFGVGGGIVIVPLLLFLRKTAPRIATATSLGAIALTAIAGVVLYAIRGEVHVWYALLVGIPASIGALTGTAIQQRISGRTLLLGFGALLTGLGVWLIVG